MGGYGSGRPRTRPGTADSLGLDMRTIKEWGWLADVGDVAARSGSYQWTFSYAGRVTSESSITVIISVRQGWARLIYTTNEQADGVNELLSISQLGGRWYWHCPCGGRALVLYKPPGRRLFRCRRCHPVVYQSSRDSDQRVSDTYRNLIDQVAGRAPRSLDSRRLIWTLKAYDRLDKKVRRPDLDSIRAHQHECWQRRRAAMFRRMARKRWASERRRQARRAARISRAIAARV